MMPGRGQDNKLNNTTLGLVKNIFRLKLSTHVFVMPYEWILVCLRIFSIYIETYGKTPFVSNYLLPDSFVYDPIGNFENVSHDIKQSMLFANYESLTKLEKL